MVVGKELWHASMAAINEFQNAEPVLLRHWLVGNKRSVIAFTVDNQTAIVVAGPCVVYLKCGQNDP